MIWHKFPIEISNSTSDCVHSRLWPRPERAAGPADGLHRGPPSAHALLRRRGGLPVKICCQSQLALRTPAPPPLLLSDPQHRPGGLQAEGRPTLLGLARLSWVWNMSSLEESVISWTIIVTENRIDGSGYAKTMQTHLHLDKWLQDFSSRCGIPLSLTTDRFTVQSQRLHTEHSVCKISTVAIPLIWQTLKPNLIFQPHHHFSMYKMLFQFASFKSPPLRMNSQQIKK